MSVDEARTDISSLARLIMLAEVKRPIVPLFLAWRFIEHANYGCAEEK